MKDDAVIKDNEAVYLLNEQRICICGKISQGSGTRFLTRTARSRWRKGRFHGKFWATLNGVSRPPVRTIWQSIQKSLWGEFRILRLRP